MRYSLLKPSHIRQVSGIDGECLAGAVKFQGGTDCRPDIALHWRSIRNNTEFLAAKGHKNHKS